MSFNPTLSSGLESQITQCLRITINYRCHFKCNFCYVVPMKQHRQQVLGVSETLLSEADWRAFLRSYFEYYTVERLQYAPGFPVSICASDPARDPEAVEMLLRVLEEEALRAGHTKSAIPNTFPVTIINDIHRNGSLERLLALVERLQRMWNGVIWYASTAQTSNGFADVGEIDLHHTVRAEMAKRKSPWFSILTPTISETSETVPVWQDLVTGSIQQLHRLITQNYQTQMTINVIEPIGPELQARIEPLRQVFLAMYEAASRFWMATYIKSFYGQDVDHLLLEGLCKTAPFSTDEGVYYIVNEVGVIPGLGKTKTPLSPSMFGCWPLMGCYTGVLGLEPGGILSGCQFGHDPIQKTTKDLKEPDSWESAIVRSDARLRNIRAKLTYPFMATHACPQANGDECRTASCSSFIRGSCPADLFYANKPLTDASGSCITLSASAKMLRELSSKAGIRLELLAEDSMRRSDYTALQMLRKIHAI